MIVRFREVGNSMTVTIPKDITRELGLSCGNEADVFIKDKQIVIKPICKKVTIKSLFANYKGDYKPSEIDWGTKKGNEVW